MIAGWMENSVDEGEERTSARQRVKKEERTTG